jgi:hypothetical protein
LQGFLSVFGKNTATSGANTEQLRSYLHESALQHNRVGVRKIAAFVSDLSQL